MLSGDLYVWLKKKSMLMYVLRNFCVCICIEYGSFSSPEHHGCSEAQYNLLKEVTETFPRVKRKNKSKKKRKGLRNILWFPSLVYFQIIFIGKTSIGKI